MKFEDYGGSWNRMTLQQEAQRKVIKENSPHWDKTDIPWLTETVQYLKLTEKPKIANLLQLEIDKLERIPEPPKPATFRGKSISKSSLKVPTRKRINGIRN
jgi:hypothetical protein